MILTVAIVVDIFLSSVPSYNFKNALSSGKTKASDTLRLLGMGPPRASLVFFRY